MIPPLLAAEQYTLTPAGRGALEVLQSLPFVFIVIIGIVLVVLTILMPYYIYCTASYLRKILAIAERWEQWMRKQQR